MRIPMAVSSRRMKIALSKSIWKYGIRKQWPTQQKTNERKNCAYWFTTFENENPMLYTFLFSV
jgi:hypothetical protein